MAVGMMTELNTNWLAKGSTNHHLAKQYVAAATSVSAAVSPSGVATQDPTEAPYNNALLAGIAAHPNMDRTILNALKAAFAANKGARLVWPAASQAWTADVDDSGDPVTITLHCPSSHTLPTSDPTS
jgi:hypothetical protein